MGFVAFRLHKKGVSQFVKRYGEDLLSDFIPILYRKIETYNLNYRDSGGARKPVKFVSYIWKRVDGFIIDSLRKGILRERREVCINEREEDQLAGVAPIPPFRLTRLCCGTYLAPNIYPLRTASKSR